MKLTFAGLALFSLLVGCGQRGESPEQGPRSTPTPSGVTTSSVAGVGWTVPQRWAQDPPRPMRVATYRVPSTDEGEPAECGVFYFGQTEGGDVQANIERWIAQFTDASSPAQAKREVNGLEVVTLTLTGTYLTPGGPMMESQGARKGYALHAVIVTGKQGSVFFKLVGPSSTVSSAEEEFEQLIQSLHEE